MSDNDYKVIKRRVPNFVDKVKKVAFVDIIKGLSLTFRYTVTPSTVVTMRYPYDETWIPYPRYRGTHTLNKNEDGKELCVACELCVKACPTDCITVVPEEDETGKGISDRVAKIWEVNLVRCLYCGYCEDACPTTAVRLGRHFETACFKLEDAVRTKEQLLKPQLIPESFDGGIIVKASLQRGRSGIKVRPELWKQKKDWWPEK